MLRIYTYYLVSGDSVAPSTEYLSIVRFRVRHPPLSPNRLATIIRCRLPRFSHLRATLSSPTYYLVSDFLWIRAVCSHWIGQPPQCLHTALLESVGPYDCDTFHRVVCFRIIPLITSRYFLVGFRERLSPLDYRTTLVADLPDKSVARCHGS
jgi:hypothetical protein